MDLGGDGDVSRVLIAGKLWTELVGGLGVLQRSWSGGGGSVRVGKGQFDGGEGRI